MTVLAKSKVGVTLRYIPLLPPLSHIETLEHNRGESASKAQIRHIPQNPDRILDAPDIVNDTYFSVKKY